MLCYSWQSQWCLLLWVSCLVGWGLLMTLIVSTSCSTATKFMIYERNKWTFSSNNTFDSGRVSRLFLIVRNRDLYFLSRKQGRAHFKDYQCKKWLTCQCHSGGIVLLCSEVVWVGVGLLVLPVQVRVGLSMTFWNGVLLCQDSLLQLRYFSGL